VSNNDRGELIPLKVGEVVGLSYRYCGQAYFSNGENPTRMKIYCGKKYAGYKRLTRT